MNIIYLLVSLLFSGVVTFLLIKHQDKINLFSEQNHRSMHKKKIPESGGIAIFLSFIFCIFLFDTEIDMGILGGVIFMFLVGLYDDKFGMNYKQKVFSIFIVANILYFSGFYIEHVGVFFGHEVVLNGVFAYLLLSFALVGFINAINLIDGLDGLVGVVGIIILSSFLYMGVKFGDDFLIYFAAVYICSLLGFLFFNWSPAKIFMGDNGSLMTGLIIAIVSIHAVNQHYTTLVSTMLLTAVPILDTFIIIARRLRAGKNPFEADKQHMHHIIYEQQGKNTKKTVFVMGLMQLLFSYMGLGFKLRDDMLIVVLFLMLFVLFYFLLNPNTKES
jgi:UDP-GlcNAc:undecaprenyl-phosphate GlcNAc-1-phosphate transferase